MITEHGSDSYKAIVAQLDPCSCHVCQRGAQAQIAAITGEESAGCAVCGGDGVRETDEGERTCSACLGGG